MPLATYSAYPEEEYGSQKYLNIKDFQYLNTSGFFHCQVTSAKSIERNSKKEPAKKFKIIQLDLVTLVMTPTGEMPNVKLSVSFPIFDSELMGPLLYFTQKPNSEGQFILQEPVHKSGKLNNGNVWEFDEFTQFSRKNIYCVVDYLGMNMSQTGKQYPIFKLIGITSKDGQSAYEHSKGLPAVKYINMIKAMQSKSQAQPQAYGQQQTQQAYPQGQVQQDPQQAYHPEALNVGQRLVQSQSQPMQQTMKTVALDDNLPF